MRSFPPRRAQSKTPNTYTPSEDSNTAVELPLLILSNIWRLQPLVMALSFEFSKIFEAVKPRERTKPLRTNSLALVRTLPYPGRAAQAPETSRKEIWRTT